MGMCQQPVPGDVQVGDVVAGHRVAGRAHRVGRRAVRRGDIGLTARPGASARAGAARRRCAGRPMKPLLQTSCRQAAIRPPASSPADSRASIADPSGDQRHLVLAAPHAPGPGLPGRRAGQQRGVHGRVVGAVLPVDTRAFGVIARPPAPGRQPQRRMAIAPRSEKRPWLWLHTVTASSSQRAIAQLGAIEAWARKGRVNSAVSVRADAGGGLLVAAAPPRSSSAEAADSRNPFKSCSSGRDAGSLPVSPLRRPPGGEPGGAVGRGDHAQERAVAHEGDHAAARSTISEVVELRRPGRVAGPPGRTACRA